MEMLYYPLTLVSGALNFTEIAPKFGPMFNTRCIFGMSHLKYKGSDGVYYSYQRSIRANYSGFTVTTASTQHLM